ncbi:hypothetical protein HKCCE3408_10420 [Rhodobacterales bacterium HKCCE3408]|nr:hypothetical protein [Rhodobacterales bacterium HKCCE3408]
MRHLSVLLIALSALPAAAEEAVVQDCGPVSSAWNIAEPWEQNTLTFANGAVRLAILDTIEPAAAAFHLLVLSPPYDELGGRQCRVVSLSEEWMGFGFLSFERWESSYDPATGLRVVMDMGLYNPETGLNDALSLAVTINQATGEITGRWP